MSSFTSHSPAESRNFDCIYDTSFAYPSVKDELRVREEALRNACAEQCYPKYDMMFAATPRSSRLSFRRHENSRLLPYKLDGDDSASMRSDASALGGCLRIVEGAVRLGGGANNPAERRVSNPIQSGVQCRGKNRNLYFFKPSTNVNVVNVKLSGTQIPQHKDQTQCNLNVDSSKKKKRVSTRGTQTLYRESSAQTLPYTPNVANKRKQLETLELFKLPSLLPGDKPPGLYEVERLERARKRWLFAKKLRNQMRQQIRNAKSKISLGMKCTELVAFEWERWIEREEELQECQMLRLELVIRMLDKREKEMHDQSKASIEIATVKIQEKRDAGLRKNEVEFKRGIRRLEMKRAQKSRTWKKEDIIYELGNPASEAYAPQLRYGTNPRRRQFTGGRQAFNNRIGYLDKVIMKVNMNNLTCPFSKIDKWAQPKGRIQEVEQRFCSDENLKKLYESLRSLRQTSDGQKIIPKCLIEKVRSDKKTIVVPVAEPIPEPEEVVVEEEEQQVENVIKDPRVTEPDEWLKFSEEARKQRERVEFLHSEIRQEELDALLADYEGTTIGWLMRFLSEEMDRLQELRKLHFITMIAQKERWRREAAEAGLRQKENEMRKVYEQLFYETNQANIEVCKDYLDDILMVDTYQYADDEATEEVVNLAKVIDTDLQRWMKSWTDSGVQNPMNFDKLRYLLRDTVFPDVEALTRQTENEMIVKYIIDDVLFPHMAVTLDPYDVGTITANELVDRLMDTDLYYFTPDCTSECDNCTDCHCSIQTQEAQAILRKMIRRAVPGRRWFTPIERLGHENLMDIVDDVVDHVETKKMCQRCSKVCVLKSVKSEMNLFEPFEECKQTDETEADGISRIEHFEKLGEPTDDDRTIPKRLRSSIASSKKLTYEDFITIEQIIDRPRRESDSTFSSDYSLDSHLKKDQVDETNPIDLRKIYSQFDIISHISNFYERDMVIHESSSSEESGAGILIDGRTPQRYREHKKTKNYLHYLLKDAVASAVPAEPGDSDDSVYLSEHSYLHRSVSGAFIKTADEIVEEEEDESIHPGAHALGAVMKRVDEDIPSTEISEISLSDVIEEKAEQVEVEQPEEDENTLSVSPSEMERLESDQCKCQMEIDRENLIRRKLAKGKIKIRSIAPESLESGESELFSYPSSVQELTNEADAVDEEDFGIPTEPDEEDNYDYEMMEMDEDLEPNVHMSAEDLPSTDTAQTAIGLTIDGAPQPDVDEVEVINPAETQEGEIHIETIAGVPTEIDVEEMNTEIATAAVTTVDPQTTEPQVAANAEEKLAEENAS